MEMRQLVTFRKVAQMLSFTQAATELSYAQSSVTAHVKALEATLGVALFERTMGRVRLTPAGERLVLFADRIIDLAGEAKLAVCESDQPTGTVVVGTTESIASYRLAPVLELLHHRFPRLRITLRPSRTAEIRDALRQGLLDVGFLMDAETEHRGLTSIVLREEDLVVVAAPDHPLADRTQVTLDDLRQTKILATEPGCTYRDLFEAELNEGYESEVRLLEFGTIEAIKRMAANGLGATLLPRFTVANELAAKALVPLAWPVPFTVFTQLAWHQEKWMSGALRLFTEEIARAFDESPFRPEPVRAARVGRRDEQGSSDEARDNSAVRSSLPHPARGHYRRATAPASAAGRPRSGQAA
jgi:DNA-binding transcriptional LysR family regulator